MTRRRLLLALRIAAWAAVGACVLIFAHKLDWARVIRMFEGADLGLALAATLAGVPALALQGLRWSSLVKGIRRVPRSIPVTALFVGQAASVFLPMRAGEAVRTEDRKSTRLNSSHLGISYAVFCLKKKNKKS